MSFGMRDRARVGWSYAAEQVMSGSIPAGRVDFLRRVYTYFLLSIVVSGLGGWLGFQNLHLFGEYGVLPFFLVEIVLLVLCMVFQRAPGLNLILLGAFALVSGFTIAPAVTTAVLKTGGFAVVQQAYLATLLVFGGLTGYVFWSGKDFSYLGGFLFLGLVGLLISGLLMALFGGGAMMVLYSWATLFLFGGFVLFDTSRILYHYEDGQEIGAAIGIYLDFVNIFLAILNLLSSRRD